MTAVSTDMAWRRFVTTLLTSLGLALSGLYGLVLMIDPYDALSFSPDWKRYPVSRHSRDYNAILARRPEYNSAVIGNSTSMLLPPTELNQELGARFVMLSMPAASPFEQRELIRLFQRHHSAIRNLVVGLDSVWCHPGGAPRVLGLMENHPFPYWLYDENPWNDLPPLDETTLKKARMQAKALLGLQIRYEHKPDGYWDFSDALHKENDPESIRRRLHAADRHPLPLDLPKGSEAFPDLADLENLLGLLPAETEKILFFAPTHHLQLPTPGSDQSAAWEDCKHRAAAIAGRVPRTLVVDFRIPSPLSENDAHFIDAQHYTRPIASELIEMLSAALRGKAGDLPELRVLARSAGRGGAG